MKLIGGNHTTKHTHPNAGHAAHSEKADTQKLAETYKAAEKKKKHRGRGWLIALLVLIGILLVGFAWFKLWRKPPEIQQGGIHTAPPTEESEQHGQPEKPDDADVPSADDGQDEPDISAEPVAVEYDTNGRKKGTYTFLLVGSDNGFGNTDTIIYAVFDTVDHTLNLVNIPRDTQVNVPWSIKRINAVYANAGNDIDRLRREVGHMVGYEIDDSYAIVDLEAFVKIVDCIGGVDYDVPVDMFYSIPDQNFNIALLKGYQHLDGNKALQVVRYRAGYANADLGRINTQQDFLMTVAKQMLSLKNIPNLPELFDIITEYVETDLSTANIAFFIEEFLKMDAEDIHFYTVPGEGHMVRGGAYYFVSTGEWVQIVNEGLNPFNVPLSEMNMNYLVYKNGDVYTSTGDYYGTSSFLDYDAYIQSLTGSSSGSD